MTIHDVLVNIGDSDLKADWIKTGKGHQLEAAIHDELAERFKKKGGPGSGFHGHAGRPGQRGGSAAGGGAAERLGLAGFEGEFKSRAAKLVEALPAGHTAHLSRIQALTPDEIVLAHGPGYSRDAGIYKAGATVPFITLNKEAKTVGTLETALQRKTLAHEIGHSVHHKLNPKKYGSAAHVQKAGEYADQILTGDLTRAQAARKINTMYGKVKRGQAGAVTDYAKTDVREFFSESYAHYVSNPRKLRAADVGMYDFLKTNLFGGQEYASEEKSIAVATKAKVALKPHIEKEDGGLTIGEPDEFTGSEVVEEKGGAGSGHFGHGGRPGQRGGSAARGISPQAMVAGHVTRGAAMKKLGITHASRMNSYIKYGMPSVKEGGRRYIKWPEAEVWFDTYVKGGKGKKGIEAANKAIGSKRETKLPKPPIPPKPPPPPTKPARKLVSSNPTVRGEGDTSNIKWDVPNENRLSRQISILPQNHLDSIRWVEGMSQSEAQARLGDGNWAGLHTSRGGIGGQIYLIEGAQHTSTRSTLMHETGHAVHSAIRNLHYGKVSDAFGDYGQRGKIRNRITAMYKEAKAGKRTFISNYAKTNSKEYFAESYEEYILRPSNLKGVDSGMYNFMRNRVFGGVEYTQARPGSMGWTMAGGE